MSDCQESGLSMLGAARAVLLSAGGADAATVLTTVGSDGWPHAAWMGVALVESPGRVFTLTSPDSRKVTQIEETGKAEWMWVDAARETVLYLRGDTRVVRDVPEMKRVWAAVPDKSRAYFLSFFNPAPGYAVIETKVREVVCHRPREGRAEEVDVADLFDVG